MAIIRITTPSIADDAVTTDKYIEYPPYRNLIINGDMSVAQRGTSSTGITGNGYAIDRYRHQITNAGTWTISQSTDVPTGQGFTYSQKLDCTTADTSLGASDRIRFQQRIEGNMLQSLKFGTSSAESITISFWVKSNKTGTYSWSACDISNTKLISASYTIDSADTWEKKTLTFAGTDSPSISINNTAFLQCSWWLGVGSTYSGGTYRNTWTTFANSDEAAGQTVNLADNTANEWYITGVQLEVGTTASDFEFLPHDVNLQRCQRYYQQYGASGENLHLVGVQNGTTTGARLGATLIKDLRTNGSTSTSGTLAVYNGADVRSSTVGTTRTTKFAIDIDVSWTGTMGSQGYTLLGYIGGNCTIKVDAEL